MTTYGFRVETPGAFDRLGPNNNNQKASVIQGSVTVAGRIVRLGGWVEKKANDSRIAFGIWNVDANGKPTTLVARTDRFEPPATGRVVTQPVRNPVSVGVGRRLAFGFMVSAGDVRVGKATATATVYRRDADEMKDFAASPSVDPNHVVAWAIFADAEDVPAGPDPGPVPPPKPDPPPTVPDPTPVDPLPPYVPPATLPPYPTNLSPVGGTVVRSNTLPLISWDCFDPLGRTVNCRLYFTEISSGTTRSVLLLAPTSGTRWAYQATSALMPANGLYEWWVAAELPGINVKNPSATERLLLTWTPPIVVAVTAPAENAAVATNAPAVSWTVTGGTQVRWRARLYSTSGTQLRATDWIGSAEASWTLPLTWGLRRSTAYRVEVEVDGGGGASAVSPRRTFRVEYTPPANLTGVTVSNTKFPGESEASTPRLQWDQTALPVGEFGGYVVRRYSEAEGSLFGTGTVVAHLTQRAQVTFWDTAAPANEILTYRVTQLRIASGVVTESGATDLFITAPLKVPTLSSVYDGASKRYAAMWLGEGLGGSFTRPETGVVTWGSGGRPTLISTPASYGASTLSVSLTARTDATATLKQRAQALQALVESGDPVVWRGEGERLFCRVASWSWERGGVGERTMNLELEEIAFDEGVDVVVTTGA